MRQQAIYPGPERTIGGAKTSYTYRKEEDSGDYDVQLQSRKAKRHGELDI